MSNATLRKLRVALYSYQSATDDDSGVTTSSYVRQLSPDEDGLWWASRGTTFGRQGAPALQPQAEQTAFFSLSAYAPVTNDGLIVEGDTVYLVQSVMPRDYGRDAVQAFCTQVDDADDKYVLEEPEE